MTRLKLGERFLAKRIGWLLMVATVVSFPGCGPSRNDLLLQSAQRVRSDADDEEEEKSETESPAPQAQTAEAPAAESEQPAPAADVDVPAEQPSVPPPATEVAADAVNVGLPSETGVVELRTGEAVKQLGLSPIGDRTPEQPLSETERRKMAVEHLEKVAEALLAYARDKKRLPPTFSSANGFQTLSWRVEILPYLGYQELYDKFDTDVPWNKPPNDELVKYIPDVYVSPERFDTKTNIVMPSRSGFIGGDGGGSVLNNNVIEDGVGNTLLLVEVNDDYAVPWSAPEDLDPENREELARRLFKLREDGAFAVWANGWTTLLASGTNPKLIWDAMTTEAGDGLMAGNVHRDIPLENVSDAAAAAQEVAPVESAPMPETPQAPLTVMKTRDPVPSAGEVAAVQDRFRTVYSDRIEDAKKDEDKLELADEMLDAAADMTEDPVGAYALQTAAMRMAIEAGGINEVIRGINQRVQRFEVDAYDENMSWMIAFGRGVAQRDVETIDGMDYVKRATKVIYAAIYDDDYLNASALARYSYRLIDQDRDEDIPKYLNRLRGLLGQAKREFDEASGSLAKYRLNANDGEAAADIGRFLCFIKGDWQRGLPLLTEGGPEVLQDVATLDLKGAQDYVNKVVIGDAWWELSVKARSSVYRQSARDRASYWYGQAFEVMPDSLDRLHVKARLDEAEEADATSPLAMIQVLADEVGVDLTVSLAAVAEVGGGGGRGGAHRSQSRDEANEG